MYSWVIRYAIKRSGAIERAYFLVLLNTKEKKDINGNEISDIIQRIVTKPVGSKTCAGLYNEGKKGISEEEKRIDGGAKVMVDQ